MTVCTCDKLSLKLIEGCNMQNHKGILEGGESQDLIETCNVQDHK